MLSTSKPPMQSSIPSGGRLALLGTVGLLVWLLLLFPLVPATGVGLLVAVGSGCAVLLWAFICVAAIVWVRKRLENRLALFQVIGALVAISCGVGIFLAAYQARAYLFANFAYWSP
jgi:amino acid transporter